MKTNDLISINIPTYNNSSFISDAIESVCSQTYPNWELIIIDDGSEDNTEELVRSYVSRDSRIKYFKQPHSGHATARNLAVTKSSGKYISFLDSDDIYEKNALEELHKALSSVEDNTKIAYGNHIRFNPTTGECIQINVVETLKTRPDLFFQLMIINPFMPSSMMIEKSVLFEFGNFDKRVKLSPEFEIFLRISKKYNAVKVNSFINKYRIHHHQVSSKRSEIRKNRDQQILTFFKSFLIDELFPDAKNPDMLAEQIEQLALSLEKAKKLPIDTILYLLDYSQNIAFSTRRDTLIKTIHMNLVKVMENRGFDPKVRFIHD